MVSKSGASTIGQFSCFFRGGQGELGGKGSEHVESHVKKYRNGVTENVSDIIDEPLETNHIKDYISVDEFMHENQLKKLRTEMEKQRATDRTTNSGDENKILESLRILNEKTPRNTKNLYERIASEMRSKQNREGI